LVAQRLDVRNGDTTPVSDKAPVHPQSRSQDHRQWSRNTSTRHNKRADTWQMMPKQHGQYPQINENGLVWRWSKPPTFSSWMQCIVKHRYLP
jgi:hypothetical protein